MSLDHLKELLRKFNLKPNFTYGQNFLLDEKVLEDIIDAADISSHDQILEIGPGLGNLTRKLCEKAGLVLSIEKDPKFLPILKTIRRDYPDKFRYEIADALEFNFQDILQKSIVNSQKLRTDFATNDYSLMANHYKVVANIPYYITGKILEMLMKTEYKPSSVIVLTQKEVAERVCAKPGGLSVLAISVQIFGEPQIIRIVPSSAFYPAPKVDSAILQIQMNQQPKYEIGDEKKFFRLLKACFAGKRKQIHNTLVNNLKLDKDQVAKILSVLKINPAARPQELAIEAWIALVSKILFDKPVKENL